MLITVIAIQSTQLMEAEVLIEENHRAQRPLLSNLRAMLVNLVATLHAINYIFKTL
jgi:hypothetical protein